MVTTITAAIVPFATFLIPVLFISMPFIAWGADKYAQQMAKQYAEHGHEHYGDLKSATLGSNPYQYQALMTMSASVEDKAAWLANSDRNLFGFTKLPLIGLGALIAMITLSATSTLLPVALFSTTLAIACPIAFAAIAVVFLAAAGIYMHSNRDTQVDNRYKLNFDNLYPDTYRLYFDEDMDMVENLSRNYVEKESEPMPQKDPVPQHHANPLGSFLTMAKNYLGFGSNEDTLRESPTL